MCMGEISFEQTNHSKTSISYSIKLSGEYIGTCEGYLNNNVLVLVIHIYRDYQGKGYGYIALKTIIEHFGEDNIHCISASWNQDEEFSYCENGMSANLLVFQQMRAENQNDTDCIYATPTGKWMKKLGYNKFTITQESQDSVNVDFYMDTK